MVPRRKMTTETTVLTVDNINPNIKAMEYAVRGPLIIRAHEIEKELLDVSIQLLPVILFIKMIYFIY